MKYVSWKSLQSWACLGCGVCCKRYIVKLNELEVKSITDLFVDSVVEKDGTAYLRKHEDTCVFQMDNLCGLQPLGLKPLACKVWPFYISATPLPSVEDKDYKALFLWHGQELFVYVNTFCRGLNKGSTPNIRGIVKEVTTVYSNPELKLKQYHSTSRHSLNQDLQIQIQAKLRRIMSSERNHDNEQRSENAVSRGDEPVSENTPQSIQTDLQEKIIKPAKEILNMAEISLTKQNKQEVRKIWQK